jgi:hypothetical protein
MSSNGHQKLRRVSNLYKTSYPPSSLVRSSMMQGEDTLPIMSSSMPLFKHFDIGGLI